MTRAGRLIALFPSLHMAVIAASVLWLCADPGLTTSATVAFVTYLLAPICFRLHSLVAPLGPGRTDIGSQRYSPWWGAYQFQSLYIACPFLEAALRLVPGAYSAWLRLWGSRVGCGVFWTPRVEILDRSLLDIGDGVLIGHDVKLIGHFIAPDATGRMVLRVGKITIGDGAIIGAGSRLGPDVVVGKGASIKILADIYPGSEIAAGAVVDERQIIRPQDPSAYPASAT